MNRLLSPPPTALDCIVATLNDWGLEYLRSHELGYTVFQMTITVKGENFICFLVHEDTDNLILLQIVSLEQDFSEKKAEIVELMNAINSRWGVGCFILCKKNTRASFRTGEPWRSSPDSVDHLTD